MDSYKFWKHWYFFLFCVAITLTWLISSYGLQSLCCYCFVQQFLLNISQVQRDAAVLLAPFFSLDGIIMKCLEFGKDLDHIMDFTRLRALNSLFSMLNQGVRNVLAYNRSHDFPMQVRKVTKYSIMFRYKWGRRSWCVILYYHVNYVSQKWLPIEESFYCR